MFNEYAKSFFALINDMYAQKASEMLDGVMVAKTAAANKDEGQGVIDKLSQQSEGLDRILDEVETVEGVRRGN